MDYLSYDNPFTWDYARFLVADALGIDVAEFDHFEEDDEMSESWQYDHYGSTGEWAADNEVAMVQIVRPRRRVNGEMLSSMIIDFGDGDGYHATISFRFGVSEAKDLTEFLLNIRR